MTSSCTSSAMSGRCSTTRSRCRCRICGAATRTTPTRSRRGRRLVVLFPLRIEVRGPELGLELLLRGGQDRVAFRGVAGGVEKGACAQRVELFVGEQPLDHRGGGGVALGGGVDGGVEVRGGRPRQPDLGEAPLQRG